MSLAGMKLAMVFSAIDRLTGPVQKMVASVVKLENVAKVGQGLRKAGDGAVIAGAAVDHAAGRMRAGIAAVLQPMMAQEDAAAALSTVMVPSVGSVADATERARKEARAWSEQHSQGAAEFLNAAYQMASAGLAEEQAIAGTKAALTLAKGALGDNVAAANLLAVVYNTMGDRTAAVGFEMTRLSDVLAKTQQQFQLADLQQLGEGLKYGIPAAQMARMNIVQLSAAIGQLNSSGLQGSMAGTALAQVLSKMSSASKDLGFSIMRTESGEMDLVRTLKHITDLYGPLSKATTTAMYDTERSTGNVTRKMVDVQESFKEAFGDEGLRAIALLTNNIEGLESGFVGVQNSTGAAGTAAERLESTTSSALSKMKNQVENIAADIGGMLLPVLEQVKPKIVGILESIKSWMSAHPGLTALAAKVFVIGTALATILGPAMMFTGMLVSGLGRVVGAVVWTGRAFKWAANDGFEVWLADAGKVMSWLKSLGVGLLGMAKKAIVAGAAFMATPVGWLTAALLGLAAAIAYVALKWEDLTGQTNTFAKVAPDMANRLKSDAKFKQQMVSDAMSGNTAKQTILSSVFKEEFDKDLWSRVNFEQQQRKREAMLQSYGFGTQAPTPGQDLVNVPKFDGKPAAAVDRSVRIDRIEINNTEPMDEDMLSRMLGRRLVEAMDAQGSR